MYSAAHGEKRDASTRFYKLLFLSGNIPHHGPMQYANLVARPRHGQPPRQLVIT